MAKPLLLTGWCGPVFAEIANSTLPLMERYAARHGMDYQCVNLHMEGVPPPWVKIPRIIDALGQYETVLWLDADVVVVEQEKSILDGVPAESWQAVVTHRTNSGEVPNTGVWVLRQAMLQILRAAWSFRDKYLHHPWWEQAAILERMGFEVTPAPYADFVGQTELYRWTTFLPAKWNHHPHDARRVEPAAFYHITQYPDRAGKAKEMAQHAN